MFSRRPGRMKCDTECKILEMGSHRFKACDLIMCAKHFNARAEKNNKMQKASLQNGLGFYMFSQVLTSYFCTAKLFMARVP